MLLAGLLWVWWTSRTIVTDNSEIGVIRYERLLGRILKIEVDADRDGRPDAEVRFRWADKYDGTNYFYDGPYCDDLGQHREDRDGDGRWDTWFRSVSGVGPGRCLYSFEADTTGDGRPDWRIRSRDAAAVFAELYDLRGF
jgi:hypothetical protein